MNEIKPTFKNLVIVGVSLTLTAIAVVIYGLRAWDWLAGNPLQTAPGTQVTGAMKIQTWVAQAILWVIEFPQGTWQVLGGLAAALIVFFVVWPEIQRLRNKRRRYKKWRTTGR